MADIVLAIDIGTSSVKAIGFDLRGNAVPALREHTAYSARGPAQYADIDDADELMRCVAAAVQTVLDKARDSGHTFIAVGVCTFWHSMVGIDSSGQAVTPLYTWADTRPSAAANRLNAVLDTRSIHARTGCAIHPSYFPARLAWLAETEPALVSRVTKWVSPGEYLFLKLFGEAACSISMASATGMFDQNEKVWDPELISYLGLPEDKFSQLTDVDAPVHGLCDEWAKRWPELAAVPWVPAIGDGAASNVGSGCVDATRIAINLGTSGAIRIVLPLDTVEIPDDLWCYRLDRDHFVLGGAFSDGGNDLAWALDTLALPDQTAINHAMASYRPDSHGLTFLPFLAGERSTGWRPSARGTLHGITNGTTSMDIFQAIPEGVALRFAYVFESLLTDYPDVREVIASGGALARAPYWAQIIADAISWGITLCDETEASCRGAAIVALKSIGKIESYGDTEPPSGTVIAPDPRRHADLRNELIRQQELYRLLS